MNCLKCGHPLREDTMICPNCGSRNDVGGDGRHFYTANRPGRERICPRCNDALETVDFQIEGAFYVEKCPRCEGLFFDPGELEKALDAYGGGAGEINLRQINLLHKTVHKKRWPAGYIKCPVCRQLMSFVNFGAGSGVIVDRCLEHGVWLDGGELNHLIEWAKAGGKLLDEQRKGRGERQEKRRLQRLRQENARFEYAKNHPLPGATSRRQGHPGFSGTDEMLVNGLISIAKRLFS